MHKFLHIGETAPGFNLIDHKGKLYSLDQSLRKGPVVLQFYPFDQSPNCKERLCFINQLRDEYWSEGISVFGINNAAQESHANFADKINLTMPLLSDPDFQTARSYQALFEIGPIKVIRTTTVAIGTNGKIMFYKRGNLPAKKALIDFISRPDTPSI